LSFIERRENVVFLGPPGVGKTHLVISLAIAAAEHGRRVYYATLADRGGHDEHETETR
jgi:DNA replication protein DnaC